MPTISERGQRTPLSPFRKLVPLADKAKAAGRHIYHLNIGQPDILTLPGALPRTWEQLPQILAYSPANGLLSYRQKLVDYYRRFDVTVSSEEIVVTTGGSEAILFFMLACLDPGDEIIIPEPFYANYNGFAHMSGVKVIPVTCHIENGFALPPIEAFAEKITSRTKAIFITNPNNPTGVCYEERALQTLAELVAAHDLFLCVDEVYREFVYDDARFISALQLDNIADQVVVVDSVSKRYSACGARVGALVTRNEAVLEAVIRLAKLRLSPPGLGQLLAEGALENDASYLEEVQQEYDRRRQVAYRRLAAMPGVTTYLPRGAFYAFARFPVDSAELFCRWLLEDFSLDNATVMLSPGEGFYATPGLGVDEVRLAFVLNETDLEAAMDCLEAALAVYPGRLTAQGNQPVEVEHCN